MNYSNNKLLCIYLFSNVFDLIEKSLQKRDMITFLVLELFLVKFNNSKIDEVISLFESELYTLNKILRDCSSFPSLIDELKGQISTTYQ